MHFAGPKAAIFMWAAISGLGLTAACDKKAPENPPAPTVVTTADTAQPATPDPAFELPAGPELAWGYGRSMNGMRPPAAAPSPLG